MNGIGTRRHETGRLEMTRAQVMREAVTWTAAVGFFVGGFVRTVLGGPIDLEVVLVRALYLPLGAAVAAVLAGIVINLIALPALSRVMSGRGLPDPVYVAAGALSGLAAFTGAFAEFLPRP